MLQLYDLSVNGVRSPAFVPRRRLYFGWKLASDRDGVRQAGYRIQIEGPDGVPLYDTGDVASSRSHHVPFEGTLPGRADCAMTVTVTDDRGERAAASLSFGTDIAPDEWAGCFIRPRRLIEGWAPVLRAKFTLTGRDVRRAKLYACGLGCAEYRINGERVGEDLLDPPFTNYEREVLYRIYDVAGLLRGGRNAIAATLGEGWYAQSRVWGQRGMKYGDVCLLAQLEIEYADGTRQVVATNPDEWSYRYGPVVLNNLYAGETYDSRLEIPGFADPDGDEEGWGRAVRAEAPAGELRLCEMPPVRIREERPALSVTPESGANDGAWVFDFGVNLAGVVEIRVPPSPRGARYVLRFAENVGPCGTPDYRSAGAFATQCIQEDVYIARGDAEGETWRPRFTYHGFRYMELTGYHDLRSGYGAVPDPSLARALAVSTDLASAGSCSVGNADLDRLQRIMLRTILSNYHGFPEDCPAREKCGWLGDAQIVSDTAIMNLDMEASYLQYLSDIRSSDDVYGVWQMIAPGKRGCGEATPLWGCAQVILPHRLYRYYGCERAVRDNWDRMEAWMRHELDDARAEAGRTGETRVIRRGLGDWCPPVGSRSERRMPVEESSTLMFFETALCMDELSRALDLPASLDYRALAGEIRDAFLRRFWRSDLPGYATWGTCGAALLLGLYPEGERERLLSSLLRRMEVEDYAMPTGIYGNKYLVAALCENGCGDQALRMLLNRRHDSFATMMDKGATSLWECIESEFCQPRGQGASSYNHPMHAGFGYFLYAYVGGIRPEAPGFSEFAIDPVRFTEIPSAEVRHVCPYGEIAVSFRRDERGVAYEFTVPPNTVCRFRAGGGNDRYLSGRHSVYVED